MKLAPGGCVWVRTYGPLTGTGAFLENAGWTGRSLRVGLEPAFSVAASATGPVVLRARVRRCRCPPALRRTTTDGEETMRSMVSTSTATSAGRDRRRRRDPFPGRIEMSPAALELFAASLDRSDRVALEVSSNAVSTPGRQRTSSPRARSTRSGCPTSRPRRMRRRLARRTQLVRVKTKGKNEDPRRPDAKAGGETRGRRPLRPYESRSHPNAGIVLSARGRRQRSSARPPGRFGSGSARSTLKRRWVRWRAAG